MAMALVAAACKRKPDAEPPAAAPPAAGSGQARPTPPAGPSAGSSGSSAGPSAGSSTGPTAVGDHPHVVVTDDACTSDDDCTRVDQTCGCCDYAGMAVRAREAFQAKIDAMCKGAVHECDCVSDLTNPACEHGHCTLLTDRQFRARP